jgi:thioredoxin-like negative regulator of GroEL
MHRLRLAVALSALALLSVPQLAAQQVEPLQKSDIIRLLTGTTYTKAEVAGIVRQSCLSFSPTERDRADFQSLGADDAVMSAIDGCTRQPAGAEVQLSMDRRIFSASVGDTVRIPATVTRSGSGVSGLRLRLVGSAAIRGGAGSDAVEFSDAAGSVSFEVPVGTSAATYNMTVDADVALGGPRAVTLRVSGAVATQASAAPDPLPLVSEQEPASFRVEVRDRFGNPVSGASVTVRAGSETGAVVFSGTSGSAGELEGQVAASTLGGANRLVIMTGSTVLGFAGIARPAARAVSLLAISGERQQGDFGETLPEPLVVEVTDADGRPSADVEVRFSAVNGAVEPGLTRTDADGRAETRVTMGSAGAETTVTATVGDIVRTVSFHITQGGMTVAATEAALLEAARMLSAGDYEGARGLYGQVVEADPSNLGAAVGVAESYSVEGRYDEAVESYRAVLRTSPSRRDAQAGMARASLAAGNAAEAARWFDLALSQDRTDVDAFVGLGDARTRLGQREQARTAYEQALLLDPGNEGARRGLDRLSENPSLVEGDVWGGYTDDNGRDPGFRWAELRAYPGKGLDLWLAIDNALNFRHPYLVRGQDDIEAFYGGIGLSYGENRAHRTSFEIGRRKEPVNGTVQTTWTLDQTIGFASGSWLRLGGWLGHWWDRDDWVVFAETGVPAGPVVVKPVVSYGDYFGSGLTGIPEGVPGRAPAKELRVGLHVSYDPATGVGVEPGVAYGNTDSDASEELSGSLWDATLGLWYRFSDSVALKSFFQYQAPPGLPSFWRIGLGLELGVSRTN